MYTQAVEFGAQIAKQTSKNGASVVEAGAQAGEEVRESVFASGLTGIVAQETAKEVRESVFEGASVIEAGTQAGEEVRESVFASGLTGIVAQETAKEVRETLDKKDEGLLDKIGNFFAGGLLGIGAKFGESLRNN